MVSAVVKGCWNQATLIVEWGLGTTELRSFLVSATKNTRQHQSSPMTPRIPGNLIMEPSAESKCRKNKRLERKMEEYGNRFLGRIDIPITCSNTGENQQLRLRHFSGAKYHNQIPILPTSCECAWYWKSIQGNFGRYNYSPRPRRVSEFGSWEY